jgi:peptidoglycan endopeptidase LytE
MQGCRREPAVSSAEPTNAPPALESTNVVADATPAPVPTNLPSVVSIPPAAPAVVTDYTIVQGDNFSALAKRFGVSVKAISDANPGVDSSKLRIGQKIHIPPAAPVAPAAATPVVTANGEQLYTVKSGDTLIKIAAQFGTSVKAIRSLNSLKTDSIKVGQKLKIPAKGSGSAPASAPSTEPAPSTPAPAPGAAPQSR